MLKLVATLFLILGGSGIGYARSRELTEREKNLEILLQILFLLKGEIRCGNSSLPDAFGKIADKIEGFSGNILRDAAREMENGGGRNLERILEVCIQRNICEKSLPGKKRNVREELRFWQMLGSRLGYLDREMQIQQIEQMEIELEICRKRSREKLSEQKKICRMLGIMAGIMLAVLLW